MQNRLFTLALILLFPAASAFAQKTNATSEDSLINNLSKNTATTIGGYGNAFYQRNNNLGTATVDLQRFVLFAGHKFSDQISFFSELEVEDAKVTGGEPG